MTDHTDDDPAGTDRAADGDDIATSGADDDIAATGDDPPDWTFSERDLVILEELAADPGISSRELAGVLEAEYDVDVSHVTVSESIRKMRAAGVFREAIVPNEAYYTFALFEFKFDPSHFAEEWRDAMASIRDDPHTLLYFLSDGEYQWKSVMMFPTAEAQSRWIHEFYKEHGAVVSNLRNHVVHNVLKFRTDPEIFRGLHEG
ncbi:Lrp/AsnC family transcriptional regulator [Halobaculum halobium]|uniref:Lrp/AsnC family transcriptional regulator n=1 Tax=Halobaculum halobium TaxID=3032281 RepID=A0ABD5TE97_9EURY|nr:winged helix-turn-helix domain-containing protein [Halobaculum sp. SYNS20]